MGLYAPTDPSMMAATLSAPGYGYASPLLLPQVAAAYQNDPKTALIRSLLQSGNEGLKAFMPSGKAVAGRVLASGLGALASALQGNQYQEANQNTLDTMKQAYAAAQGTPAQTDADGNITTPAIPPNPQLMGKILMGNAATAPGTMANMQAIALKYAEPTKLGRGDILTTPGSGQTLAANTLPSTSFGQLVQERSALANANPNDPRIALYDSQIAKGNQEGGVGFSPTGAAAVPGFGQAKAAVEAPAAGAVETAKNPALIARARGTAEATYPTENALAQNKPQVIEPGYRINIDPNRVVPPGTAPLQMGGGPIAPPPGSTPAPGSPAYSAASSPRTELPPSPLPQQLSPTPLAQGGTSPRNGGPQPGSAATSAAGGSRPGTPPPATAFATTPPPAPDLSAITRTQNPGGGITLSSEALPQRVVQPLVEADRKEVGVDREKAIAGQADQANIRMIQDFLPKVQTGWSAETKLEGARILKAAGVPDQWMNDYLKTDVATGQLLTKQFLTLSTAAARSMGAREPGSVIQMFRGAYPGIGTDPQAINLQTNALYMDRQRTNDMAAAKTNFLGDSVDGYQKSGTYRGLKGFNEDFAKTNPPEFYLHAAEAMSGAPQPWMRIKAPDQQQAIINLIPSGTKFLAPDGQMRVKP